NFEFPPMPAGAYVVSVSRKGFAPWQYGQEQWQGAGTPVVLQEAEETAVRVALPRFGAIAGRISDEADVGLVEHVAVAYRNTRPPAMAGKALTDDRGVYRIADLEPGTYVVRAAAKMYDDGGYLPTFYKETPTVDGAQPVEVALDRDTVDVSIRPAPGRLFVVSGEAVGPGTPPASVSVSLVSDMGPETVTTDERGRFRFNDAASGKYELLAMSPRGAGWMPIEIDRDRTDQRLMFFPMPLVEFVFVNGKGERVDTGGSLQVTARRKELSGPGAVQYLQLTGNRATLMPGRWEFSVAPNPAYYTHGWSEAAVGFSSPAMLLSLSVFANPAAIHGVVSTGAGEPAAGAPVFLEGGGEARTTRTDIHGAYTFVGLAPGEYRVHSTGGSQTVQVEEGQNLLVKMGTA
ncbi:MAG TPA: carboxypeptidase-like regulatory domain-containing protein, partial [Candidatus Sulfopaludibacter sp.]|nr:carboxypeptidase-like regulatory domain-containing protein [Candidatus Sulfopaludibacter sp.]